jgi:uncharacterized Tic20 family protein
VTAMNQRETTSDWALFLHLSLLLGFILPIPFIGIIVPIIIWQAKKDTVPNLDQHGRNAINWIISSILYSVILLITVVGIVLLPILAGLTFIFPIVAAIQASRDQVWKYPITIDFIGQRSHKALSRIAVGLLALCILPLLAVVGSGVWVNHRSQWLADLSRADGVVVEVLQKTDEEGDQLYNPVIEFQDEVGESYEVSPVWWTGSPTHRVEDRVEVLYPAENPEKAIINNWFEKWSLSVITLIVSGFLLLFSLIPSLFCWIFARFV